MRRTIFVKFPIAGAATRALLAAAGAALVGGCTVTPWTDNWQTAPSSALPPSQSEPGVMAGYYRVNPGDTLAGIAAAFGQRPLDVASWNHLALNDTVTPGQVLRVAPPPGATTLMPPVPLGAPAAQPGAMPSMPSMSPMPATPGAPGAMESTMLEWPAQGRVTTPFIDGQNRGIVITSNGTDLTVHAAAAGRVVYSGSGVAAYGPLVILKHENGLITAYGHNAKLLVNEGDAVSAGQPIAEMAIDPSGRGSFEFEVRENGKPVDPLQFLPPNGG